MNVTYDDEYGKRAEKAEAVRAINDALRILQRENREPDAWERQSLGTAVNATFRGAYRLAAAEADLAMTPPSMRSPEWRPSSNEVYKVCSLKNLRAALAEAEADPLRSYPHFGPVVLVGKS
jgi:hypothetical protein